MKMLAKPKSIRMEGFIQEILVPLNSEHLTEPGKRVRKQVGIYSENGRICLPQTQAKGR